MSEMRVSNETLGKVVVQVVKDLEKKLKTHEKTQDESKAEIKAITDNAVIQLKEELNKLERFSVDLSPLDEKMIRYIEQLEKATENAKKEFKTPMLGIKVVGVFAFTLISVLVAFYFMNDQAKELKIERADKEHFIQFIKADEKRINDYKNWRNQ